MIFVNVETTLRAELIATRRLSERGRRYRLYYHLPDFPELLLQCQGETMDDALLESLQGHICVAMYSWPGENDPKEWRRVLPELANYQDILHKISIFQPREAVTPPPISLTKYLIDKHITLMKAIKEA